MNAVLQAEFRVQIKHLQQPVMLTGGWLDFGVIYYIMASHLFTFEMLLVGKPTTRKALNLHL